MNHTDHSPITIYLEPREKTLFGNSSSLNQQLASAPGKPQQCAPALSAVTGRRQEVKA